MKTNRSPNRRAAIALLAALLLGVFSASAVEPKATGVKDAAAERMLLLHSGKVVRGAIEKTSAGYLLKRGGGIIRYSEADVAIMADSLEEIYQFKRKQFPAHDVGERVTLALWLMENKLYDQMEAELHEALRIAPENVKAKRLLAMQEKRRARSSDQTVTTPKPAAAPKLIPASPRDIVGNFIAASGREAFDNYKSLELVCFNKCGASGCHGGSQGGGFRLYSRGKNHDTDIRLTARNLAAFQSFVDVEDPNRSKILWHALNPHGPLSAPPLGGVNDPLYRDLFEFVMVVAENNSPKESPAVASETREEDTDKEPMESDGERKRPAIRPRRPEKPVAIAGAIPARRPVIAAERTVEPNVKDDSAVKTQDAAVEEVVQSDPPPQMEEQGEPEAHDDDQTPLAGNEDDPFDPAAFNQTAPREEKDGN